MGFNLAFKGLINTGTYITKQGRGGTHIIFCELLLVTISESVLLMYYPENIVKNITVT
jgi:hypothetical protein